MILVLAIVVCVIAALPAYMVYRNQSLFSRAAFPRFSEQSNRDSVCVSVLIPARNEAEGIARTIHCALNSNGVSVEVVVLDDDSNDATPEIVAAMSQRDPRVRLLRGKPLPVGWNGKQHACWQLSKAAKHPLLLFLDADVRLSSDAIERLVAQREASQALLLSAFPYQETETFWERLLIPMMHYILLSFLPLDQMRSSTDPAYAAGCGQLFLTDAEAYRWAGTHESIKDSRHDGIKLPRTYREKKLRTDICDGTDIAICRMYRSGQEVFRGLLKNATEGIANPKLIGPFTVLLLGANVLPLIVLPTAIFMNDWVAIGFGFVAVVLVWLPRFQCALQFRQSLIGTAFHPVAVTVFVALQWVAFWQHLRGQKVAWKGRTES